VSSASPRSVFLLIGGGLLLAGCDSHSALPFPEASPALTPKSDPDPRSPPAPPFPPTQVSSLVLHFPTSETGYEGDEQDGKLVGETNDERDLEGTDRHFRHRNPRVSILRRPADRSVCSPRPVRRADGFAGQFPRISRTGTCPVHPSPRPTPRRTADAAPVSRLASEAGFASSAPSLASRLGKSAVPWR